MDLPKSIVKEFAKQAVEKKPTVDKPTQLVGTVQVEDGQTFVYLDGSNGSKTPVSETVAYQSGDRVLVSIQNRKATIIGNYTDPSINQALDNVIVEYALSSNSVSFIAWPGEKGEWNTIAPEKEDGSYMWQRTTKISTNTLINPEISLTCIQGSDGENGYTPYIGSNGNWWINGVDTGYSAEGDDGHSPYVDTTTNTWWEWDADIGGYHDTGIVPQGPGVFKSIVFKRFSSEPSTPTGGSYLSPVPSGWSDGIPSGTEQIWMSTRVFTSNGESPQTSKWTTPQMVSDTPDIDFEYSWIATNPGNPTDNPGNWSNTATENSIWMAVRKKSIGTWSSWEISKIKGEDGADGEMSPEQVAQLNQASSDASAAKDSVDILSDKTRSGFIETLSGTGFVQSNKTEDGGTSEVVVYGKSVQDGTPTPDAPIEIQSVRNPNVTACGKNLAENKRKETVTISGVTYTYIGDGKYSLSGTATGTNVIFLNQTANVDTIFLMKKNKTYKISGCQVYLKKTADGSTVTYDGMTTAKTITLSTDCILLGIRALLISGTTYDGSVVYEPIICETTEDIVYEPYKGNTATLSGIVLRSLSDGTRDRLFKDSDGLWKIERNCGEVTYNGTESSWGYEADKNNCYIRGDTNKRPAVSFCSHFRYGSGNAPRFTIGSYFNFFIAETTTLAEWKTWLASNPITVVYALATPTYETLPTSIQEELNALTTYNPITNVFVSAGVTPYIDVSFWTRDYRTKNIAESIVKRVVINDDSVDIVDSTGRLLASYGDAKIELGKNAVSSIIEMCGGMARVSARYGGLTTIYSNNGGYQTTLDYDFNETTFKSKVGSNYGSYEFIYSGGVWECSYSGNSAGYVQVNLSDYGITLKTTSINEYAGITINYWDGSEATFINADTTKPSRKLILGLAESGTSDNADYANIEIERSKESSVEHSKINLLTVHDGANVAGVYLDNGNIELNASGEVLINQHNIVQRLIDMLCCADTESITVTAGTFTDGGCSATLAGNTLYLYLNAKAKSAITAGNITNQTMLTIKFTDNRISALYSVTGSGGSSGPNSQMQFSATSSGGQHTITVTLAAIAQNIAKNGVINAHISMPCVLNWDAY